MGTKIRSDRLPPSTSLLKCNSWRWQVIWKKGKEARKWGYGKWYFVNWSGLIQCLSFPPCLFLCLIPVTESPCKCRVISLSGDYPFYFSGVFCTERSSALIECCNSCHNNKLILLEGKRIFMWIPFAERYKPNIDFKGYIFVLTVMLKNVLPSIICN